MRNANVRNHLKSTPTKVNSKKNYSSSRLISLRIQPIIFFSEESWEERQWWRTQIFELRRGPEEDTQIDRKLEEKAPERKIKPEEDASEMK